MQCPLRLPHRPIPRPPQTLQAHTKLGKHLTHVIDLGRRGKLQLEQLPQLLETECGIAHENLFEYLYQLNGLARKLAVAGTVEVVSGVVYKSAVEMASDQETRVLVGEIGRGLLFVLKGFNRGFKGEYSLEVNKVYATTMITTEHWKADGLLGALDEVFKAMTDCLTSVNELLGGVKVSASLFELDPWTYRDFETKMVLLAKACLYYRTYPCRHHIDTGDGTGFGAMQANIQVQQPFPHAPGSQIGQAAGVYRQPTLAGTYGTLFNGSPVGPAAVAHTQQAINHGASSFSPLNQAMHNNARQPSTFSPFGNTPNQLLGSPYQALRSPFGKNPYSLGGQTPTGFGAFVKDVTIEDYCSEAGDRTLTSPSGGAGASASPHGHYQAVSPNQYWGQTSPAHATQAAQAAQASTSQHSHAQQVTPHSRTPFTRINPTFLATLLNTR